MAKRLKASGPPIASGLLLLLGFPPFDLFPILFVALVPWLLSLNASSGKGAWKRGYLFGLVFALGRLHFIEVLTGQWTGSLGLALVPWLLAALIMAIYFGAMSVVVRLCLVRGRPWLVPLVWAGMEVFRSYIPVFAFPWALIATPLWRYPALIQDARLGTIYLVGAWVVLVNLGSMFAVQKASVPARWSFGVAAALLLVSLGLYQLRPSSTATRVTVGQTGIDMAFGDPQRQDQQTAEAVAYLERRALQAGSRLLVLPEGSARIHKIGEQPLFPVGPSLPVLFGAQTGSGTVYQSAVAFDGRWQSVDKTRLVIFGEFVPGRDFLPFLSAFNLPGGDLSAGEHGTQAVTVGHLRVGPLICFEALFPDLAWKQSLNGAHLLAVISIDDWFRGSSAPEELRAGTIWRAVETGIPVVRAASLGYSLAVDGQGRLLAEAPRGPTLPLEVDLPVPDRPLVGYWLPVFPIVGILALFGAPFLCGSRVSRP